MKLRIVNPDRSTNDTHTEVAEKSQARNRIVVAVDMGDRETVDVRLTGSGRAVFLMARKLRGVVLVTQITPMYTTDDGLRCLELTVIPSLPGDMS